MILLIDNYDSFTYNLADYLHQLRVDVKVFRNDEPLHTINQQKYSGVILSPGPGTPATSGNLVEIIQHFADTHPVLGICLGHQAIGTLYGARLVKALKPMHGKISEIRIIEDYLFADMPEKFNIVRYHSLILDKLPSCLEKIAQTPDNEIMALRHKNLNIRGLQFHPEAFLTQYGFDILRNWINKNYFK